MYVTWAPREYSHGEASPKMALHKGKNSKRLPHGENDPQ